MVCVGGRGSIISVDDTFNKLQFIVTKQVADEIPLFTLGTGFKLHI